MRKVTVGLFLLLGVAPLALAVSMSDVKEDFESHDIGLLSSQGWVMVSGDGEVVIGYNGTKVAKANGGYLQGTHGAAKSTSYVYSTGIDVSGPGQAYFAAQFTPGYAGLTPTYTVIGTQRADGYPGALIGIDAPSVTEPNYNGLGRFIFEGANYGTKQLSEDVRMFDSNGTPYTFDVAVTLNITNASSITATLYYRNVTFNGDWVQSSLLTNVPFNNTYGIQNDARTYLRGYIRTDIDNFRMGMGPAFGDDLTISPNGGNFTGPVTVTISGATEGSTIHYTLNGADPTSSDPVFEESIVVNQKLTLKARAFLPDGYATSRVAVAEFKLPFVGTTVDILPKYDLAVEGPPYYYVVDYPNSLTLTTNYSHGQDTSIFYQFDLSSLAAIPLPDWSTGLRINSVEFCGVANSAAGGEDAVFQDALYPVSSDWTPSTITYANRPARGPRLCTWDFTAYTAMNWYYASSPALTSAVQAALNNPTSKLISFNVAAVNPPNLKAGSHYYLDNLSYSPGAYSTRLRVYYDFAAGDPVDNVTISPNGGSFTGPVTVTLSCDTPDATIYYTLDGTDPTQDSHLYSTALVVDNTTMIKARAYATGRMPSPVAKAKFVLPTVGTSVTVLAVEDASASYVNLGNMGAIWMGNYSGANVQSYLKFSIPELENPPHGRTIIHSAFLAWCGGGEEGDDPSHLPPATLYQCWDNTWTELGVTVANWPALGEPIETFNCPGAFKQVDFLVTDYLQAVVDSGNSTISFAAAAPNWYINETANGRWRMTCKEFYLEPDHYGPRLTVDYSYDVERAAAPVITPPGGVFGAIIGVTMACDTPGAVIRYTLDGSTPNENSAIYSGPIPVNSAVTVKAVACPPADSTLYLSPVATATFEFTSTFDPPSDILYGTAIVDGDLSEWPTGTADWTPLNVVYDGSPSDIAEAYYCARWTEDKIYVAVKVLDLTHVFTDNYTEWNARDAVEIYLHTTGKSADYSYSMSEAAQEYAIGIMYEHPDRVWTDLGYKMDVPEVCAFEAAGREDEEWLYYEVAMTPFHYMGAFVGQPSVMSPVFANQVIGLDVVVAGNNGLYTGMKSANNKKAKSNDYSQFGVHRLVNPAAGSTVTGTVVLADYIPGADGKVVSIEFRQAGDVVRNQNFTLEGSGQFTILGVPAGTYDVWVWTPGWLSTMKSGVVVSGQNFDAGTFTLANGDTNGDNQVTFEDFATLQNHYGQSVAAGSNGDFNGDGQVTFADFAILQNSYGQSGPSGAASASESNVLATTPCGLVGVVLLALMGLISLRLRD